MRVLLANSEALFRGGEFQTIALARGLVERGCEVMIACRAGSALSARAAGSIPCAEYPFEDVPVWTPLAIARLVSRFRPAVLHAQTSNAHTHVWFARRLVPGAPPLVVSRRVAFPIRKDLFSLLKYRTGVAHYIPISRAAAGSLLSRGVDPSRMTVIPSGIDVAAFAGAAPDRDLEHRWGFESERCLIGTVAAFEAEKGHWTLVRAVADVLRECPAARFVLVGEGKLRGDIEAEIARLGMAGTVKCVPQDAPLEGILPLLDIFVLPSLQEGLSTALIAAMAAGIPVVGSMTGGIPEVVTPGTGMLVPPGDHEALARAIVTLVRDKNLRETLGVAAARRAAHFDIKRTVEDTLEVYAHVVQHDEPKIID